MIPRGFGEMHGCQEASRIVLESLIGSWRVWERLGGSFVERMGQGPGRTWTVHDYSQMCQGGSGRVLRALKWECPGGSGGSFI